MSGNIAGSSLNTVSLAGISATMQTAPQGSSAGIASWLAANAGLFTTAGGASVYNAYFGGEDGTGTNAGASVSGMWGASWTGAVTWTVSGTGSSTSSYNIAAVTLANSLTGNELVAVSWVAAGVTYIVYDCVLSSLSGAGFTITAPAGQKTLPATGTTVTLATNMDAEFPGDLRVTDQILATASQMGHIALYDTTPVLRYANALTTIASVQSPNIPAAGNFWGVAYTTPTLVVNYVVGLARYYNLSTVIASASVAILMN